MRGLVTQRSTGLPPLGWILAVRPGEPPRAIVGESVYVARWGFSDGVWAGDLDRPPGAVRFGASVVDAGAARGHRLTVLPASHTLEQVFVGRGRDFLLVSNYLPLLCAAEPGLLPWRLDWGVRLAELSRGMHAYSRTLLASRRGRLERYACHRLVIENGLSVCEAPEAAAAAPFATFDGYRDWLVGAIAGVSRNAADPRRPRPFPAVATCSSGYDSSAVAALARETGCTEALGIAKARDGAADGGADIARALGIRLRYVERHARLDDYAAALPYLASGMSASDYALHEVILAARGRLLLTGVHGDMIWRLGAEPSRAVPRGDLSGAGIQAARIHLGLQHLPVPMLGACWHPEILGISGSAEMRAYRVGGSYDRPIPRRIVEEAGVPREAFGRRKAAANLVCRSAWDALGDPALRRAVEERVARLSPLERVRFRASQFWHGQRMLRRLRRHRPFPEEERTGPLASAEFLAAVETLGARLRPIVEAVHPV